MARTHTQTSTSTTARRGLFKVLAQLHDIKIGGISSHPQKLKVPRKDLSFILSNLSTLAENGVSLPRALATLARERSLKKYQPMLDDIRRKVESGEPFSSALASYPQTFDELMTHQVKVGERSGTVADALGRISNQLEHANELRAQVVKRLSYPLIVVGAGVLVVGFLLMVIVPVFEETYRKAHLPLPLATRVLVFTGHFMIGWGWLVLVGLIAAVMGYRRLRRNPLFAYRVDRALLSLPLAGDWLRNYAVLQFVEVLGTMLESGFKLVDALGVSAGSVGNRAVRSSVDDLRAAVVRGERLSHQLELHGETFPPVVSQLVIVGEQTGKLNKSTRHIRDHLRREIQRKTEIFVSAIEPLLTIGMATAIGGILLAIYLPMFSMVDMVDSAPASP